MDLINCMTLPVMHGYGAPVVFQKKRDLLKVTPTLFTSCKVDEGQWAKTHKIKLIVPRSRKKKSPVGFLNGLGHYLWQKKKSQFIHSNRLFRKFPALAGVDDVAQYQRAGRGGARIGLSVCGPQSVRMPSNRLVTSGCVGDMPSARCEAPSLGKRSRDFSAQPGSLR